MSAVIVPESAPLDVLVSFDTTQSMYPCLTEVRAHVKSVVTKLQTDVPGIRIALLAHGDYGDEKLTYMIKKLDFTTNPAELIEFITNTGKTHGQDYAELYEKVLREAQGFSWNPSSVKAFIMVGDAVPHEEKDNPEHIDWRVECDVLKSLNIPIYSVQALSRGHGPSLLFWKQLAERTNGYHLFLDQFSYVRDILIAICLKQVNDAHLLQFEQELADQTDSGVLTTSMRKVFDTMLKRAPVATAAAQPVAAIDSHKRKHAALEAEDDDKKMAVVVGVPGGHHGHIDLAPCAPAKYQILQVPRAMSIKQFVESQEGLVFAPGASYYEFSKPELIGVNKEIVLQHKVSGELFEGSAARQIAGITDEYAKKRMQPCNLYTYRVFVQSTSYNRKLVGGTGFLYQATDFGRDD